MNVLIEAKKIKLTQAIRAFATEQATRLNKLGKNVDRVRIYLENTAKNNTGKFANAVVYSVSAPRKHIVVKKYAADMYQAITEATDAALRSLRKTAEKRLKTKRNLGS